MPKLKVINLYGGPGTGKSSTAYTLAGFMKWNGMNCELVTEYAKDLTWDNSQEVLADQTYVFAEQYHRLFRLKGKVDIVITDSPLPLSIIYGVNEGKLFGDFILDKFNEFDNYNFLLERIKPYSETGRNQTEEEAKKIDFETRNLLLFHDISFTEVVGDKTNIQEIITTLKENDVEINL